MKAKVKREPKIDWMIHAIANKKERNNPECEIDYITSGFDKYGFGGEVIVVGKVKNAEKIANLINTFCCMLIQGENFDIRYTHCIDNTKRETEYRFNIVKYETLNAGAKYQLIPLFDEILD